MEQFDITKATNGDFIAFDHDDGGTSIMIYQGNLPYDYHYHYHAMIAPDYNNNKEDQLLLRGTCCYFEGEFRKATESEKDRLLNELSRDNWKWDEDTKHLVSLLTEDTTQPTPKSKSLQWWAKKQYAINCKKGWHDPIYTKTHYLFMIVTEVAEAAEADRKQKRCKTDDALRCKEIGNEEIFYEWYYQRIKGTIEEEFADICLRIIDLAYKIYGNSMKWKEEIVSRMENTIFTEKAYHFIYNILREGDANQLASAVSFVYGWAYSLGINLNLHIKLKLRFNGITLKKGNFKRY